LLAQPTNVAIERALTHSECAGGPTAVAVMLTQCFQHLLLVEPLTAPDQGVFRPGRRNGLGPAQRLVSRSGGMVTGKAASR